MFDNKIKYRKHCSLESSVPIFSQAWWLDAVCFGADNWDVAIVEKDRKIIASMPYYIKHKFGFTLIVQPALTQNLGPWVRTSVTKYAKVLGQQKDIMEALIEQLPDYDLFQQNWHYSITNWLPFYWKGYSQTTRYTYILHDLSDLNKVFSEFEHAKRKNIKKSENIINIVFDITVEEFYENHKKTLAKQNAKISYTKKLFKRIYEAGYRNDAAKTIAAYDKEGNLHAALFVIWDNQSAYNLISTIDPDYRKYGAATLLIKEIIKYVSTRTNKFDFEGSMIEGVERSFRQFGAKQTPYLSITKIPSCLLRIRKSIKYIFKNT